VQFLDCYAHEIVLKEAHAMARRAADLAMTGRMI
jgi:hypothetical protein